MSFDLWLAFVLASCLILVIPGPTVLTVISYSLSQGRQARLPLVAAVALGDCSALLLSLLGLGGLLKMSAVWFTAIKIAGGLYLLYLGARLLRAGKAPGPTEAPLAPLPAWRLFANTYLVTTLNPKAIVFFVAFLPQFIDPALAFGPQLAILAVTFAALASANAVLYSSFAASATRMLSSAPARQRFHLAGGSLLCAAGVAAMLVRRTP